jgi:hypothetical protein
MRIRVASLAACFFLSISGPILIGCTPNAPYRTADFADCGAAGCTADAPQAAIEKHDGFDLAFVEFTERGNVFDRDKMNRVLDYVADQARPNASNRLGAIH